MKKLFIYYSLTSNGDLVAKTLEKSCDIRKIKVKKELPKPFFLRILVGGYKAISNKKEKLVGFNNDISNYNEIIIGSPIWNDRLSTPVTTVLDLLDLDNKKLTFILYSGSGQANTAAEYIKTNYKKANIIYLQEPKKYEKELDKLKI